MREPLMGIDKTCYEKEAVRKWVIENSKYPTTRVPMEMHCLTPDHTMSRIVESFSNNHLTEEVIDDLVRSLSAPPTPMPVEVPTIATVNPPGTSSEELIDKKKERLKRKKARLKANQVAKKAATKKAQYTQVVFKRNEHV